MRHTFIGTVGTVHITPPLPKIESPVLYRAFFPGISHDPRLYLPRLAEEIINGLLRFIPELMQELTPFQRVMVAATLRHAQEPNPDGRGSASADTNQSLIA